MKLIDIQQQYAGLSDQLDHFTTALSTARQERASAYIAVSRAKDAYERAKNAETTTFRTLATRYVESSEFQEKVMDPRSGEKNQEWGQFVLEGMVEKDPEFATVRGNVYATQTAITDAEAKAQGTEAKVMSLAESLGATRSKMLGFAGILNYASGQ